MKQTLKRILSVVCVLALLASTALLFSACGEDGPQLTFELNPDGQSYTCTGFVVKKDREVRVAELVIPETYEELPVTAIGDSAFSEIWAHVQGTMNNVGMGQDTSDYVSITSVVIPDSVTRIEDGAFQYCKSLTSVTLPANLEYLGENAFSICEGLTSVTIPAKITELKNSTFIGCKSLATVTLPEGLTVIGEKAFKSCSSLTSVKIPASVTSIGNEAFCECGNLTEVTFSKGLITIGDSAFINCAKLNNVVIPEGVTTIADSAFRGCKALTTLSLPGSLENCGSTAFSGCPLTYEVYEGCNYIGGWLFSAIDKKELTTVKIKEGTVGIMAYALSGCEKLTGSVVIPNTVKFIGDHAFGGRTFQGKGSIHSITIPASVTHMGKGVFTDCGYNRSLYVGNTFSPKYFNINCAATQKPEGWHDAWLSEEQYDISYSKVNWGVTTGVN